MFTSSGRGGEVKTRHLVLACTTTLIIGMLIGGLVVRFVPGLGADRTHSDNGRTESRLAERPPTVELPGAATVATDSYIIAKEEQEFLARIHALRQEDWRIDDLVIKGETLFHHATRQNYFKAAQLLIAKGADVNACDEYSDTPLHHAVRIGNQDVVELLLANGANVNAPGVWGRRPISDAISEDRVEALEYLIAKGASVNVRDDEWRTPLYDSLSFYPGDCDAVSVLLKHGANVNAATKDGETPLYLAVRGDLVETVSGFIYNARIQAVDLLLNHGADPNAETSDGKRPLHEAALNGLETIVESLIARGAEVNAKNNVGITPLHNAAMKAHATVVRILVDNGADINAKDTYGRTPLQWARDDSLIYPGFGGEGSAEDRKTVERILVQMGAAD